MKEPSSQPCQIIDNAAVTFPITAVRYPRGTSLLVTSLSTLADHGRQQMDAKSALGRFTPMRPAPLAALLVGAALVCAACSSSGAAGSDAVPATPSGAASNQSATGGGQASNGDGATSIKGTPPANGGNGQGGSVGTFTLAFAKCMRAHGVANFPDPNGSAGQLGPNSGIDPTSAKFQAALNGPCKSLAPAPWLDSGPGSVPGGQ